MNSRPNYIPPDRIHIHGEWKGVLLVRRWRKRSAELARGPADVSLDELRRLHKQHRLRFIDRPDHVQVIITEPSAPGRF